MTEDQLVMHLVDAVDGFGTELTKKQAKAYDHFVLSVWNCENASTQLLSRADALIAGVTYDHLEFAVAGMVKLQKQLVEDAQDRANTFLESICA